MIANILMLEGIFFIGWFIAVLCMSFAYALSQDNNPRWCWFMICGMLILLWTYGMYMSITIIDKLGLQVPGIEIKTQTKDHMRVDPGLSVEKADADKP